MIVPVIILNMTIVQRSVRAMSKIRIVSGNDEGIPSLISGSTLSPVLTAASVPSAQETADFSIDQLNR